MQPLVLDTTLGKLARWLRMLGYDTVYVANASPTVLVRIALSERRTLLTTNRELARHRGIRTLFIADPDPEKQAQQVIRELGAVPQHIPPRCSLCNTPLQNLSRGAAKERVPPYVWRNYQRFTHCSRCHRVYWGGSHWDAIELLLDNLNEYDANS